MSVTSRECAYGTPGGGVFLSEQETSGHIRNYNDNRRNRYIATTLNRKARGYLLPGAVCSASQSVYSRTHSPSFGYCGRLAMVTTDIQSYLAKCKGQEYFLNIQRPNHQHVEHVFKEKSERA